MTINSKQKGASGEREVARKLREYGFANARRSAQYCGANGDADVIDALPGIHIEVKRVERLSLYDALTQAKHDCHENKPVVFHRRNNCEWVVIQPLKDWIELYREWGVHE